MVEHNVWMSTNYTPRFTVEKNDKFDTYEVVEWQNGVFGAIGRRVDGPFYDEGDAVAALQCYEYDHVQELNEVE